MYTISALSLLLSRQMRFFLAATFLLPIFSHCIFGQNPESDACHMDSSGFCMSGEVHNPPSWTPAPHLETRSEARTTTLPTETVSTSATKPKLEVEFRNDLLKVAAENVSLRETLKAISAQTGAEIEFPIGALGDRIFVHLGPATPQEVVTQLLKGSEFNYVILSSNLHPGDITRLILTRAASGAHATPPSSAEVLSDDSNRPQVYGNGFSEDAQSTVVDVLPRQESSATTAAPAAPTPNWVHHDGAILSGEQLDQIQKSAIEQEQQEYAQQLKQQRQQQEQNSQETPPQ